ncbi:glycine cleavage system protein GcvH [Planctomicrobium sp. SH668]|uniref:glycine cleavage system protein GcvH n=1 Tax=Planctomicrobium sp. SH668 TaxID=3448126 RepID=UPI003F5B7599
MSPEALKFAKTHEWVSLEGDIATVGISDFAVRELTDVVHMELPSAGKTLKAGQEMGEIESVKAVSDLYSPVSGEIVEVNSELPDDLSKLSDDPFGAGWMVKIKVSDPSELAKLLTFDQYQDECESH